MIFYVYQLKVKLWLDKCAFFSVVCFVWARVSPQKYSLVCYITCMSHMILCVWKRDKDRNTSVSRELCYHMKYQIVPPDRVCGACCRGQMYERKCLWDRDWLISPSTQATYFSSTFQWNSDTDMTRISCHFQCQSNSVCVCLCVCRQLFPSPIFICVTLHNMPAETLYNNANVHDTKCQTERSPCCSALQLQAGRRTLHVRLTELSFRRWDTNPTTRINVGDVHFCKPWICCSFTVFFLMLWQCCVYDPIRFRHTTLLVMIGKHCFFNLKYLFWSVGDVLTSP